jgi:hypothetical protein
MAWNICPMRRWASNYFGRSFPKIRKWIGLCRGRHLNRLPKTTNFHLMQFPLIAAEWPMNTTIGASFQIKN